jgi:hypothetical protein
MSAKNTEAEKKKKLTAESLLWSLYELGRDVLLAVLIPLSLHILHLVLHRLLPSNAWLFPVSEGPSAEDVKRGKVVQELKVVGRFKSFGTDLARRGNFWATHARYLHAEVALMDDVSLYCLDDKGVVFVRTPQGLDITRDMPFLYMAQFKHATHVIHMSWEAFHAVADEITLSEQEQARIVLVHSTGRAGSTMVSKMLDIEGSTSFSEPDAFTCMSGYLPDGKESDRVLSSCVKLMSKSIKFSPSPLSSSSSSSSESKQSQQQGAETDAPRVFFKFRSLCFYQAEATARLFPGAKHVFVYRNAIDVADSGRRAFGDIPVVRLLNNQYIPSKAKHVVIGRAMKGLYRTLENENTPPFDEYTPDRAAAVGIWTNCVVLWLANCHQYIKLRNDGVDIIGLKYEELVKNPGKVYEELRAALGMYEDAADVKRAVATTKEDSQKGTSIAQSKTTGKKVTMAVSGREKQIAEQICAKHKVIKSTHATLPRTLGTSL